MTRLAKAIGFICVCEFAGAMLAWALLACPWWAADAVATAALIGFLLLFPEPRWTAAPAETFAPVPSERRRWRP